MSSKTGIKKIARRIQRKHCHVFDFKSIKDIELKLWVNDIDAKPSLHLGKRGAWNLIRIGYLTDPKLCPSDKRKRSNKIPPRYLYY